MMYIKFVQTGGPFGDCTSNYDVHFTEGITVGEFIKYVVNKYSVEHAEWGSFIVNGRRLLHYDCGKAFFEEGWCDREECEPLLESIKDKKILKIRANGGWSCMGYRLFIEQEEK